jgi:hypothetical protein
MASGTGAGDTLAVWVTSNGNAPAGVSDPVNGAYTQVGPSVVAGSLIGSWWQFLAAEALTATQPPSASFGGTSGVKTIALIDCAGAGSLDTGSQANATGTSGAPSVTSGALAQPLELLLAGLVGGNSGGAPAWTAPLTGLGSDHNGAGQWGATAYLVPASAGAVTAAGTLSGAPAWGMAVFALKVAAAAAGSPPVVPVFPAGYGPLPADFTTWVQQSFGFLTASTIFRAHQQVAGGQALALGYTTLALDTIDEDPLGGWSAVATPRQPANSWLVPFTGTYEITVTVSALAAAIWLGAAVLISGGTPVAGEAALMASGTYGGAAATWTQALTGGVDYIQGQAACSAAATTDTSSPGRYPAMEITYVSG